MDACDDSDILVFVLPHKFITPTCKPLVGKVKAGAIGLSLIKVSCLFDAQNLTFYIDSTEVDFSRTLRVLAGAQKFGENWFL